MPLRGFTKARGFNRWLPKPLVFERHGSLFVGYAFNLQKANEDGSLIAQRWETEKSIVKASRLQKPQYLYASPRYRLPKTSLVSNCSRVRSNQHWGEKYCKQKQPKDCKSQQSKRRRIGEPTVSSYLCFGASEGKIWPAPRARRPKTAYCRFIEELGDSQKTKETKRTASHNKATTQEKKPRKRRQRNRSPCLSWLFFAFRKKSSAAPRARRGNARLKWNHPCPCLSMLFITPKPRRVGSVETFGLSSSSVGKDTQRIFWHDFL